MKSAIATFQYIYNILTSPPYLQVYYVLAKEVMSISHQKDERECCRVEVCIIGAGPQALTLAASLLESQPYALDDAAELTAKRHRKGFHQQVCKERMWE